MKLEEEHSIMQTWNEAGKVWNYISSITDYTE